MNVFVTLVQPFGKLAILGLFTVAGLVVATNPDFLLPLSPEIVSVACLLGWLAFTGMRSSKKLSRVERVNFILYAVILCLLGSSAFYSVRHSACWTAGSKQFQWECVLQSSILLPHGIRQFSTTLAAACCFTLAACAREPKSWRKPSLLYLPIFGLIAVVVAECFHFISHNRIMPEWAGIQEQNEWWGAAGIFTNYSWLWPYLAPSLVTGLWLTSLKDRSAKIAGWVITALIIGLLFINQQRGFGLLVLATSSVWIWNDLGSRRQGGIKSVPTYLYAAFLALFMTLALFVTSRNLFTPLFKLLGLSTLEKNPISLSSERAIFWKFGLQKMMEAPFGHGYGSWFDVNQRGFAAHEVTLLFDTPHNLFIEWMVEFGFVGMLILVGLMISFTWTALRRASTRQERFLVQLTIAAGLACLSVQEITYIRPTYLLWMTFAGVVWNRAGTIESEASQHGYRPEYAQLIGAGFCLLFAALTFKLLPFNAFPFEPSSPPHTVERWAGKGLVLKAPPAKDLAAPFLLFEADITALGEAQKITLHKNISFRRPSSVGWYFPVQRKTRGIGETTVDFAAGFPNFSRVISAKIFYPPKTFAVPIIWTNQAELIGDRGLRCTKQPCYVLLKTCENGGTNELKYKLAEGVHLMIAQSNASDTWDMHDNDFVEWLKDQIFDAADRAPRQLTSRTALLQLSYIDPSHQSDFDISFEACNLTH